MRLSSTKCLALLTLIGLLLTGCTTSNTKSTKFQPIANTGIKTPGQVIWRDLMTTSPIKAEFFYSNVFGWEFEEIDDEYSIITFQGVPIAGVSKMPPSSNSNYWLPAISSENINTSIEESKSAGAKILINKTTLTGRGEYAVIQDPQGGTFSLLDTVNGDPYPLPEKNGNWIWQELWTQDIAKSKNFYQQISTYKEGHRSVLNRTTTYPYFTQNGTPTFGFLRKPSNNIATTWVTYVKVDDFQKTVQKITQYGGKVLMIKNETIKDSSVAIVIDPTGAGFVIQELDE